MSSSHAKRAAAVFFHFEDGFPILLSFDDHPPIMPRVSTVPLSDTSSVSSPVAMNETSSSSLEMLAEHRLNPVCQYLAIG